MDTETEVRSQIAAEIRKDLEAEYTKKLAEYTVKADEDMKKMVGEAIEQWKQDQAPPTPEDIQKLLTQEYIEFAVKIPYVQEDGTQREKTFTLRELPQSVEKRFYAKVKKELVPKAQDFAALTFNLLEGDAAQKLVHMLEAFEPGFDLLAEACYLILNPFGKDKDVTLEWVQENISSSRMIAIVKAQMEVNRLRDFFSGGFLSRKSQSTTPSQVAAPK